MKCAGDFLRDKFRSWALNPAMHSEGFLIYRVLGSVLAFAMLIGARQVQAQPTIISTIPASGAAGVSTTTTVVFTFGEAMDTDTNVTYATFLDSSNPFTPLPISQSWSAGNTVLTCAPQTSFPANKIIVWSVEGQNSAGDFLEGDTSGYLPLPRGAAEAAAGRTPSRLSLSGRFITTIKSPAVRRR